MLNFSDIPAHSLMLTPEVLVRTLLTPSDVLAHPSDVITHSLVPTSCKACRGSVWHGNVPRAWCVPVCARLVLEFLDMCCVHTACTRLVCLVCCVRTACVCLVCCVKARAWCAVCLRRAHAWCVHGVGRVHRRACAWSVWRAMCGLFLGVRT